MQHQPIAVAAAEPARVNAMCDLATLSKAVDFLARRVVEKGHIPILACIRVEADLSGVLRLTATNLEMIANLDVPASVESPGVICIDADTLRTSLAKSGKGRAGAMITMEEVDGRAVLKTGRNRFGLKTGKVEDWPEPTLSGETEPRRFAMPAGQFHADLAALAPCMSKDESRYYLNGVALQPRDMAGQERLVMVATDGHAIAVASRPAPIEAIGMADVILPAKVASVIGQAAKLTDAGEVAVTISEGVKFALGFAFGPIRIHSKAIDGTYPDWERCFEAGLAPIDGEPALFPELLPGAPTATIERLGKAAKGMVIEWQPARDGLLGTVAGDAGLLFGALNMRDGGACQRDGFAYQWTGEGDAQAYLEALADARGLPSAADLAGTAEAIAAAYGTDNDAWAYNGGMPYRAREWGEVRDVGAKVVTRGTRVIGLTIAGAVHVKEWTEQVTDWEALAEREIFHPARVDPIEGSYSILMPAEGPGHLASESVIEGPDGVTYPVAVSEAAIHLLKDQVRALIGESCFETIALPTRTGIHYILRWCYENGDSRFLTVKPNGRCFGDRWQYLTRAEVDELIAVGPIEEAYAAEPAENGSLAGEALGREDAVALDSGEGLDALYGASEPPKPVDIEVNTAAEPHLAAMVAELAARVAALEGVSAEAGPEAMPLPPYRGRLAALSRIEAAAERPKRTPAHERAIRRAWAERRARREAERLAEFRKARRAEALHKAARYKGKAADLSERLASAIGAIGQAEGRRWEQWDKRRRAVRLARHRGGQMAMLAAMVKRSEAALADLKRSIADPTTPDRASDVARLVAERDKLRNACAALEARCERMQAAVDQCAGTIESLASRVAITEAALRARAA